VSCLSVVVCTECIAAKRCVLEQKLPLTAYGNKINDLDLCLEVVSRSCQPLRYIQRWISRKPLEIEAWFHRTTNRKWPTGNQMVTWLMTSRDWWRHVTPKGQTRPQYAYSAISRKQLEMLFSNNPKIRGQSPKNLPSAKFGSVLHNSVIGVWVSFILNAKNSGPSLKKLEAKNMQNLKQFAQRQTFIANISKMNRDIQNRKDNIIENYSSRVRRTLVHYPESRTCE